MAAAPGWRIDGDQWRDWVDALLASGRRVIAPGGEGALVLFRPVAAASEIRVDGFGNTRWSPKEHLFPRSEALFTYRLFERGVTVEPPALDRAEQVLFAVRPCDAAGLARLDEMFSAPKPDELYADRRGRTTVVALACESARPECFCTAVGGSPGGTEGADVLMARDDEGWLVRDLTPKGAEVVALASAAWGPATAERWDAAERAQAAVAAEISRRPLSADVPAALAGAFDQPLWELVAERCLGCGVCAYVCPSCSCFDIADEANAYCGTRCRSWDACGFASFTRHASGHNPRATQPARYRQRVLHKFAYFPLEHSDRFMCVGCGRCIALCPAGLDVHASVERLVSP